MFCLCTSRRTVLHVVVLLLVVRSSTREVGWAEDGGEQREGGKSGEKEKGKSKQPVIVTSVSWVQFDLTLFFCWMPLLESPIRLHSSCCYNSLLWGRKELYVSFSESHLTGSLHSLPWGPSCILSVIHGHCCPVACEPELRFPSWWDHAVPHHLASQYFHPKRFGLVV